MKLHQQPHLIHTVEEIELKLTYNSGNQKLLAVKGSKKIYSATHGGKGEAVTIVVCMCASRSNLTLPMALCKGKYTRA
jgi:hypothetical protein